LIRFEKENINTLSGDGEFMLTVLSLFAEEVAIKELRVEKNTTLGS